MKYRLEWEKALCLSYNSSPATQLVLGCLVVECYFESLLNSNIFPIDMTCLLILQQIIQEWPKSSLNISYQCFSIASGVEVVPGGIRLLQWALELTEGLQWAWVWASGEYGYECGRGSLLQRQSNISSVLQVLFPHTTGYKLPFCTCVCMKLSNQGPNLIWGS